MQYRVTASPYRRALFPAAACLAWALILGGIFSGPKETWPAHLALMSVPLACITWAGVRHWRGAALTATDAGVTFRGLMWTSSWRWHVIEGFDAQTRPVQWMGVPIRARRRVLGIRLQDGQTRWLRELSCRPHRDRSSWVDVTAARLDELAHEHASRPGQTGDMP